MAIQKRISKQDGEKEPSAVSPLNPLQMLIGKSLGFDIAEHRQTLHDMYREYLPDKKLTSVDGCFLIPFVLPNWGLGEDFHLADKIKVAIAYQPDGDNPLAVAYRMGVQDEAMGKLKSQAEKPHKNVRKILRAEGILGKLKEIAARGGIHVGGKW